MSSPAGDHHYGSDYDFERVVAAILKPMMWALATEPIAHVITDACQTVEKKMIRYTENGIPKTRGLPLDLTTDFQYPVPSVSAIRSPEAERTGRVGEDRPAPTSPTQPSHRPWWRPF